MVIGMVVWFVYYGMVLGNCVCLRASDGKFLALRRSRDVGEASGALVFLGGYFELKDVGFDGDIDVMDVLRYMFESVLLEFCEEFGVDEERVRRLRCFGVTFRVVNVRLCVVFYV